MRLENKLIILLLIFAPAMILTNEPSVSFITGVIFGAIIVLLNNYKSDKGSRTNHDQR